MSPFSSIVSDLNLNGLRAFKQIAMKLNVNIQGLQSLKILLLSVYI